MPEPMVEEGMQVIEAQSGPCIIVAFTLGGGKLQVVGRLWSNIPQWFNCFVKETESKLTKGMKSHKL